MSQFGFIGRRFVDSLGEERATGQNQLVLRMAHPCPGHSHRWAHRAGPDHRCQCLRRPLHLRSFHLTIGCIHCLSHRNAGGCTGTATHWAANRSDRCSAIYDRGRNPLRRCPRGYGRGSRVCDSHHWICGHQTPGTGLADAHQHGCRDVVVRKKAGDRLGCVQHRNSHRHGGGPGRSEPRRRGVSVGESDGSPPQRLSGSWWSRLPASE